MTNSMLYPALKRFEEINAVEREVVRQEGKPDRHIYQLTDRGHEVMLDLLRDFPPEVAKRDAEFLVRASFFGLLEPAERIEILLTRKSVLTQRSANIPHTWNIPHNIQLMPYLNRVLTLREQRFQQELAWIEELLQEQRLLQ